MRAVTHQGLALFTTNSSIHSKERSLFWREGPLQSREKQGAEGTRGERENQGDGSAERVWREAERVQTKGRQLDSL